jgi:hypothetical protein
MLGTASQTLEKVKDVGNPETGDGFNGLLLSKVFDIGVGGDDGLVGFTKREGDGVSDSGNTRLGICRGLSSHGKTDFTLLGSGLVEEPGAASPVTLR